MHDLVIKGARMIDGLGNPEQQVSVAVRDGRIVEIGNITESAAETVDADGRVLWIVGLAESTLSASNEAATSLEIGIIDANTD